MGDIITIAESTFSRVARIKAVYLILVICILDVWAMSQYETISLGMSQQIMFDCALAMCLLVGVITAMMAAFEIPRELRLKTSTFILSKPTGRSSFVWGKFFGIAALCLFNIGIVAAGSMFVYNAEYDASPIPILISAALVAAEAIMLTGIGIVFSLVLSDAIAAVAMFFVFAVGHGIYMLPRYAGKVSEVGELVESKAMIYVSYILPNLHHLDLKTELANEVEVSMNYLGQGLLYGVAYAIFMVGLATVIFSRKDLS